MPTKAEYEHGARKLEPLTGKDPSDDFSQDAAKNRKPKAGAGLSKQPDKAPRDTLDRPTANPRD